MEGVKHTEHAGTLVRTAGDGTLGLPTKESEEILDA